MKNRYIPYSFLLFIFYSLSAQALVNEVGVSTVVTAAMQAAATNKILPMALTWLGCFMSLQFVITNFGLLKSGADIEAVIGKLIGSMLWFGFCVYVLNGAPHWLDQVGTFILNKFSIGFGVTAIITITTSICGVLIGLITAVGTSVLGTGNVPLGMILVFALLFIFIAGMYMAIKIFMLSLELGLIVMLSPLSFSFLGLNALKDQGIAPFKALISLMYRIVLVGIINDAAAQVLQSTYTELSALDFSNLSAWTDGFQLLLGLLVAYPILLFLLYKSDSLASSLAGGSTNLGAGDLAGAVSAGVAGGMAAHAAGQAASAGVTKMSDVLKNMMGGGEMKNAGATGDGGVPPGAPLSPAPQASLGDQMQAVAASEKEMAGGGTGGSGDTGSDSSAGGGASDNKSAAPFSKADGAKAAGAVPASAGQNSKNAAAVGAAMRASGAHENMAALAEDMAEQGNGASAISNACCNSPEQSAAVGNAMAGAAEVGGSGSVGTGAMEGVKAPDGMRFTDANPDAGNAGGAAPAVPAVPAATSGNPAWLDSGNASSPGGSGSGAGIGNGGADAASKEPTMSDHLANLGRRMGEAGKHLENEKAATHVSVSTHHTD